MIVSADTCHLQKIADFHVGAENFRTDHLLNVALGKFAGEFLDECNGGVIGVAHSENDLVLPVVL